MVGRHVHPIRPGVDLESTTCLAVGFDRQIGFLEQFEPARSGVGLDVTRITKPLDPIHVRCQFGIVRDTEVLEREDAARFEDAFDLREEGSGSGKWCAAKRQVTASNRSAANGNRSASTATPSMRGYSVVAVRTISGERSAATTLETPVSASAPGYVSRTGRHVERIRRVLTPVDELVKVGPLLENCPVPITIRGVSEGGRYVLLSVGIVCHNRLL